MASAGEGTNIKSMEEGAFTTHDARLDAYLAAENIPSEAKVVACVLKSQGIDLYDEHVIPMLLDFLHAYMSDVLQDALGLAHHAQRNVVTDADVRLAVEERLTRHFQMVHPRELLAKLAADTNSVPLPINTTGTQVPLPPGACLTSQNFLYGPAVFPRRSPAPSSLQPPTSSPTQAPAQPPAQTPTQTHTQTAAPLQGNVPTPQQQQQQQQQQQVPMA